jgi:hypothetical protein
MKYCIQILLLSIICIFYSCQSNVDKKALIYDDPIAKLDKVKATIEKMQPAVKFLVPGTYAALEESHFENTYDTIVISKRRNTATIYDIKRNGAFKLLDASQSKTVYFSDSWMGNFDEISNTLSVISPCERLVFEPLENNFTWRDMQYVRIE